MLPEFNYSINVYKKGSAKSADLGRAPVADAPAPAPAPEAQIEPAATDAAPTLPAFDAELLKLYKKIPMDVECPIEMLVDEHTDLRAVMKMLLKLEMSRFVVLIPGDKVKRNLR